ncbi:MAG: hypothetical protein WA931_04255 [Rhodococcus sp. (in: high G+C Gram-positive bacteria)]
MTELEDFSFARHTAMVLGSAAAMLAVTTLVLWVLQPGGPVGLLVVALGLAATYVVSSAVAKRSLRRSFGDDTGDAKRGERPGRRGRPAGGGR